MTNDAFLSACQNQEWITVHKMLPAIHAASPQTLNDAMAWCITHDNVDILDHLHRYYNVQISEFHQRLVLQCDSINVAKYIHKHHGWNNSATFSTLKQFYMLKKALSFHVLYFFLKNNIIPMTEEINHEIMECSYHHTMPYAYICVQYVLSHANWPSFDISSYMDFLHDDVLVLNSMECLRRNNYLQYVEYHHLFQKHEPDLSKSDHAFDPSDIFL